MPQYVCLKHCFITLNMSLFPKIISSFKTTSDFVSISHVNFITVENESIVFSLASEHLLLV